MRKSDLHLSDQELLLYADGELPFGNTLRTRVHLAACWGCRARMAELEAAIIDFVQVHHETFDSPLQPIAGPRALLKARMAELTSRSRPDPFQRIRAAWNRSGFRYGFALLLLLAVGTAFLYQQVNIRQTDEADSVYAAPLPNPKLTPGATQPATLANLCSSAHDQVVRRVPKPLREAVFREYGIAGAPSGDYEIDHLVTPGLAGSDDIRNLWPEPHDHTEWNSYVKDQLEDHLHYLVCSGQLSLSTAQQDISSNWISAYQKYFHTNSPLLPYVTPGAATSSGLTSGRNLITDFVRFERLGRPKGNSHPVIRAAERLLELICLSLFFLALALMQAKRRVRFQNRAIPSFQRLLQTIVTWVINAPKVIRHGYVSSDHLYNCSSNRY